MKKTFKFISIICIVVLLFSSCASGISTHTAREKTFNYITSDYTDDSIHKASVENYDSVCKSGLIEMLFDKVSMTVAVRDTNSGQIWSTLPQEDTGKLINTSAIEVTLSNGGENIYILNSQDNSVKFGNASYNIMENGVSVTYAISKDDAVGKQNISDLKDKEIRVDLTVLYTLRDGSLYVNVSMNTVYLPKGVYLEKIKVLGSFGAFDKSEAEDYIFIPDGCGALIMTGKEDTDFSPINLSVYGNDFAVTGASHNTPCLLGVFGMKHSSSAFLCIIERGDAIAEINAERSGETSLNSVGATFKTTDIYEENGKLSQKRVYGYAYKNEITLCYRFLSGKSATYSGMATACRENLIRNSVLSTKTVEITSKNIPLIVSLQGGYKSSNNKYTVLSDYKQAQALMTLLKAKGVNNAYLRYNGLYKDANNGSCDGFNDFSKKLGSLDDYNALYGYLNSQNFSLFIDTDILTYDYSGSHNAEKVNGKKLKTSKNTGAAFPGTIASQSFLKMQNLEYRVEDILGDSSKISFDGYSFNDIGKYLYSDYSSDFYARTTAEKEIAVQIPVLASSKKIMVDNGNFYALKNADIISNIPMSPSAMEESDKYVGIPFVQMMLHGICEYGSPAVNNCEDIQYALLKSVEYGSLPGVEWYCTPYTKTTDSKYYFDNNINDIVNLYLKADSALCDIRDARMTSHRQIQQGVFCTEYNNSMKVYVNYTDQAVTINGITVNAKDCVTIS